jgi:rRNA maturation endonuclease Nob1
MKKRKCKLVRIREVKDSLGQDEWYTHFYICPACDKQIPRGGHYCMECGVRIVWIKED